jgi:hypothetical protein
MENPTHALTTYAIYEADSDIPIPAVESGVLARLGHMIENRDSDYEWRFNSVDGARGPEHASGCTDLRRRPFAELPVKVTAVISDISVSETLVLLVPS